jgi:small subunit ribosomal protein S8
MSMQDNISDMLTRIRNAQHTKKASVAFPHSNLKEAIAKVLFDEGFIEAFHTVEIDAAKKDLHLELKYFEGKPVIELISRASKPSLRKYVGKADLPKVRQGLGISIISTPKGVITDKEARKLNVGGEVICYVA